MNLGATQAWVYCNYLTWDKWTSLWDCDYPTPIYKQETLQPCLWLFTLSWWLALTGTEEDTRGQKGREPKRRLRVSFASGIPDGEIRDTSVSLSVWAKRNRRNTWDYFSDVGSEIQKSKDSMALEIWTLIPDSFSILDPNLYWDSLVLSAFGFLEIPFIYPVINLSVSCSLFLSLPTLHKKILNFQVQTKQ